MLDTVASHKSHIFTLTAQAISRCVLFHTPFQPKTQGDFPPSILGFQKPHRNRQRWTGGTMVVGGVDPSISDFFFGGKGKQRTRHTGFFRGYLKFHTAEVGDQNQSGDIN